MPLSTPSRAVVPLLALAALSILVLRILGPGTVPLSGQSPVSPATATQQVPPTRPAPVAPPMPGQSPVSPPPPMLPAQPAPAPTPAIGLGWMFSEPFWVSPLPWVALGLILFSALAWALVSLLRRLDRDV